MPLQLATSKPRVTTSVPAASRTSETFSGRTYTRACYHSPSLNSILRGEYLEGKDVTVRDASRPLSTHVHPRLALQQLELVPPLCRGAWARVTIDQFRHLALQTC